MASEVGGGSGISSAGTTVKGRKRLVIITALAIAAACIIAVFAYYEYHYESGIMDYISDECWYVSAARNILRTYFHVTTHGPWGGVMVTIQISTPPDQKTYEAWANDVIKYVKSIGGRVVKGINYYSFNKNGNYLPAICAVVPKSNLSKLELAPHNMGYYIGYCYPNAAGITTYMNFEHPPLVKYLIGLTMVLVGDYPPYWRIPSIIAGCSILLLIFLALRRILGKVTGSVMGLVAMILTALDITFRSMSMVALLDIFVALFTYLTYYFTLKNDLKWTSISLGLGFISKWTGAFAGFPAIIAWFRRRVKPASVILYLIYVPLIMFFVSALPFIIHDGFAQWWSAGVTGAIKWHLSIKTTGGPPKALPWDWLIGRNPFPLHYVWSKSQHRWVADLIAAGNPTLYLIMTALSIYLIPCLKKLPDKGLTWGFTWGTFFMYVFIYILGAKTQYSFYSVQLVPLFYTLLVIELYYLLSPPRNIIEVAKRWWRILVTFWDWLAGYVEIKFRVEVKERKAEEAEMERRETFEEGGDWGE